LPKYPGGSGVRQNLRSQAAGYGRDPDQVRVLPGLSFLLAANDAEAAALKDELEAAASSEFRWRNLATWPGSTTPPSTPTRPSLLSFSPAPPRRASAPPSTRWPPKNPPSRSGAVAQKLSALPGGLDFTGTPQGIAQLITDWWDAGATDGFTIMPNVLPGQLAAFVDHMMPILQKRGIARTEYAGTTLRDHVGLPRPARPMAPRCHPERGSWPAQGVTAGRLPGPAVWQWC
jgi:alkanesulfonate monooxygenase SsuD/methylene tetrahydromethanopterin reductase-like flavin-dependent oxidoreductase (luciferase family)